MNLAKTAVQPMEQVRGLAAHPVPEVRVEQGKSREQAPAHHLDQPAVVVSSGLVEMEATPEGAERTSIQVAEAEVAASTAVVGAVVHVTRKLIPVAEAVAPVVSTIR